MKIDGKYMNYIYAIVHNPTGRIYIGNSGNANRIQNHLSALKSNRHPNQPMQDDCNKYGFDYSVYLLEIVKARGFAPGNDREKYWIHYYASNIPTIGYNSPKWYVRTDITTFPQIEITTEKAVRNTILRIKADIDEESRETIGKILRRLRGSKSRDEVAEDLGISVRALESYENDEKVPRDATKQKIADYYNESVDYIFYDHI